MQAKPKESDGGERFIGNSPSRRDFERARHSVLPRQHAMGRPKARTVVARANLVTANEKRDKIFFSRRPKAKMTNHGKYGGHEGSVITAPPADPVRVSPVKEVILPGESTLIPKRGALPRPKRRGRPRKMPRCPSLPLPISLFCLYSFIYIIFVIAARKVGLELSFPNSIFHCLFALPFSPFTHYLGLTTASPQNFSRMRWT
jgi:hypothetical protein